MTSFNFITVWKVEAPVKPIWDLLTDPANYPSWWKGVEKVDILEPGNPDGIGCLVRQTWKSKLPYRLIFETRAIRIDPMTSFEVESVGELKGTGLMRFKSDGNLTTFQYDWNVSTTKAWMNVVSPIAKPLFDWNHNIVMNWGAEGLGKKLGGKQVQTSEKPVM